jgi:hypothetical protein
MDKKLQAETLAMVLLLAVFPVTSWGATTGNDAVWWLGFSCLVAGGLIPVMTRYMDHPKDRIADAGIEFDERVS